MPALVPAFSFTVRLDLIRRAGVNGKQLYQPQSAKTWQSIFNTSLNLNYDYQPIPDSSIYEKPNQLPEQNG
jgi:hypothetical protein